MSKLIYITLLYMAKIAKSTFYVPPPPHPTKKRLYHNHDIKYVKSWVRAIIIIICCGLSYDCCLFKVYLRSFKSPAPGSDATWRGSSKQFFKKIWTQKLISVFSCCYGHLTVASVIFHLNLFMFVTVKIWCRNKSLFHMFTMKKLKT